MSILDGDKVDMIATRPNSSVVKLVIADHLEWDDLDVHRRLLQAKINTYVAFVESGQLAHLPDHAVLGPPEFRIALVVSHVPTPAANEFLLRVGEFLTGIDIEFETEVRPARGDL